MDSNSTSLQKWQPRPYPSLKTMEGRLIRLEPIDIPKHIDGLCDIQVYSPDAPQRFRYLFSNPFKIKEDILAWLTSESAKFVYVIIDKNLNKVVGNVTLLSIIPEHGSIEIGVYFSDMVSRKPGGTEAFYLILRHIFDELKYRR